MDDLYDLAREALALAREHDLWFGDRAPEPLPLLTPDALACRLAVMLEITHDRVSIALDGPCSPDGQRAVVFEVVAQEVGSSNNAMIKRPRFSPVPGHETTGAFFVLAACRACSARDAAVAAVSNLAELGFYFATGLAPRTALWELICQGPGHDPHCIWVRRRAESAPLHPPTPTPGTPVPTSTPEGGM